MSSTTQKILKLLMLTKSDNDHEALSAIRKANQILAVHNLNWEGYIGVAMRLDQDAPPPPRYEGFKDRQMDEEERREPDPPEDMYSLAGMSTRDRTAKMLKIVREKLEEEGSPAIEFVMSLHAGFEKYGSLTERQYAALKRFYDNARRPRAPF